MKTKLLPVLFLLLPVLAAGCASPEPQADPAPAAAAPVARMDMLQLMRAFPFPHANVLFDAQARDPEGPEKQQSMSFSVYRWWEADVYAGWAGVENSSLALAEMAPLLLTPRACANGNPAPVDRQDWKDAVDSLVLVGQEAYEAARTKNVDAMLNVGESLTNACAACHNLYRDVDLEGGERCRVAE